MAKKKRDKRQRIPLSKYTRGGRISVLVAIAAIIIFCTAVVISVLNGGNAGWSVGVLGIVTFLLGIIGFLIGIHSFQEEMKFLRYSWIGTIANLAIWVSIAMIFLIYR